MTEELHLDYATRDYDGFRELMLSVIQQCDTAWTERAAADVGIMVVELLAYELDRLAYAGDRVAEESFLATARRRESARRHAALGDYTLDRGNATRGFQWFRIAGDRPLRLPARTLVAEEFDPRSGDAARLYAETLDAAQLDARRNWFVLAQSAPAGSRVLRLASRRDPARPSGRGDGLDSPDLGQLGFAAGMALLVGMPLEPGALPAEPTGPLQFVRGEVVRIASVMPHALELAQELQSSWPGGEDGAWVLGNVVEVRRGRTSDWTEIGRGGAVLGELPNDQFLQLRMEMVRRLRAEVEDARASWIGRPELERKWECACNGMTRLRGKLLRTDPSAYDVRDPRQRRQLTRLDAPLVWAARLFRSMLVAVGHDVPDELAACDRVAVPGQEIELPSTDPPVLWMDADRDPRTGGARPGQAGERPARNETLAVAVGIAGAWSRWTEVPDLLRSAPDDPHYVVEIDGNSRITLRFGDGVTGAVLPVGCLVMARWTTGDDSGDDIRAGTLSASVGADPQLSAIAATSNPLPTTGGRAPELLDGIAARVELRLERPAVPVTAEDYQVLLGGLSPVYRSASEIIESAVTAAHGVVDIVIRPAPGIAAGRLLEATRAWADRNRLAGTTVEVRLARRLPIDIGLVVDVHPDVSADHARYLVQRQLVEAFGDAQARALGRRRERAEIYRVVEGVPGILWSQVVVFDLAGRTPPRVLEDIVPARDQIVRCAGVEDPSADGRVTIWTARRYALQLTLRYGSLDARPEPASIQRLLPALLSGPASLPAQGGWTMLTADRIDEALAGVFAGAGFTVTVARLLVGQRAVDRVELGERELPILDTTQIAEQGP